LAALSNGPFASKILPSARSSAFSATSSPVTKTATFGARQEILLTEHIRPKADIRFTGEEIQQGQLLAQVGQRCAFRNFATSKYTNCLSFTQNVMTFASSTNLASNLKLKKFIQKLTYQAFLKVLWMAMHFVAM
jgi:hypothetical protein